MYRKTKNPIDVSLLINKTSGTLAQINQKTNFLKQISSIVRQICPDLPVDTWRIGNIKQNVVVIEVVSAVWSQRLQFEKNRIAQTLSQASNGDISQIQIKVTPEFSSQVAQAHSKAVEAKKEKPKKHLSTSTAEQLKGVAEKAPKSLQEKLLKLAALATDDELKDT